MSSIEWLKLDGIRSYCYMQPNASLAITTAQRKQSEVEQTIHFKRPVTLIWGHNGSGKTTIIEALRVVTTGTHPPNSDKGKNFLTDSQLLRQTQTQATIELGFRTLNQKDLIVRRHFTVTHTQGQSKFNTGRSTIQTRDSKGALETLNHTCMDVDRQIPFFLGVSIPVLTNVIFCHQEEQLWMFSDNSTLKKIFDELFDTTQFSRLQEQLKEQIKRNTLEIKRMHDLVEFGRRDMMDQTRLKEQLHTELIEILSEGAELGSLQKQLNSIKETVNPAQMTQKQELLVEKQQQISVLRYKLQTTLQQIEQLQNQQPYDDLVNKSLHQLKSDRIQLESKQLDLQAASKQANNDCQTLEMGIVHKQHEVANFEADMSLEGIKQELKLIRQQLSNLLTFKASITDEQLLKQVKNSLTVIKDEHHQELDELNAQIKQSEQLLQQLQLDKNDILVKQQLQSAAISKNNSELSEIKNQIQVKEQFLRSHDIHKVQNFNALVKFEQEKITFDKITQEYQSISNQILVSYENQAKQNVYSNYRDLMTENDQLTFQLNQEQQQIDRVLRNNGWGQQLMHKESRLQNIQVIRDKLLQTEQTLRTKEAELMGQKAQIKQQLVEFAKQRSDLQDKVETVKLAVKQKSNNLNFETAVKSIKQELKEAKEDRIKFIFNTTEFIDQYIDGCQSSKKCILCFQPVDSSILDKLRQRVQSNNVKSKGKLAEKDAVINRLQSEKQTIISNKEQFTEMQRNIDQIKSIDQQTKALQDRSKTQDFIRQETDQIRQQHTDLNLLDQLFQSSAFKQREQILLKLKQLELQFPNISEEAQATIYTQNTPLQSLLQQKQQLQEQINESEQRKYLLQQQAEQEAKLLSEQQTTQLTISTYQSELPQLKQKLVQLGQVQFVNYDEKLSFINEDEIHIQQQLQSMLENRKKLQTQFDRKIAQIEQHIPQLEKLNSRFIELKKKNRPQKLIQEQIEQLQQQISIDEQELNRVQQLITKLKEQIQIIQDMLDGIKLQLNIVELKDNDYDKQITQTQNEIEELQIQVKRNQQIQAEKLQLESRFQIQKEKLLDRFNKNQQQKLDCEKRYKNSEQKYQDQLYQHEMLKTINTDFEISMKSMEDAMIEYHRDKMKEINQYLHDTWQKIYHGKDIKFIEIRSDEEVSAGKRANKSYNYRLVMRSQNNVEIDMRGRCSMGQKMLASIVFRLALAESFGNNCGVLALDEPTSNLDKTHIQSLAESLCALIEIMSAYKQSFQLLIITHDIELVKLLSKFQTNYYQISKKDNGFSCIEDKVIDDLF